MRIASCLFVVLLAVPAAAQIWPETWQSHTRAKSEPVTPADLQLWAEYGGETAERANYNGPVGRFTATAYRLGDATGALAWYQAIRPANAVPVRGAVSVATTPGSQVMAHQNYVLVFEGWRPLDQEMAALYPLLPKMRSGGGLPKLLAYLPEKGLVRNSERYLLGLESLAKFEPSLPGSLVGFEDGVEGMTARYRLPSGREASLVLLEYPTPQLARKRFSGLEKQQGWALKRSGPFIALAPGLDPKTAAPLLDPITWEVQFTWNEATKFVTAQDVGQMMMAIFELAGLLLVVCLGGGLVFAAFAIARRRRRTAGGESDAEATFLHLN